MSIKSILVVDMYSDSSICSLIKAFPLDFCIDGWVAACSKRYERYILKKKDPLLSLLSINDQKATGWSCFLIDSRGKELLLKVVQFTEGFGGS